MSVAEETWENDVLGTRCPRCYAAAGQKCFRLNVAKGHTAHRDVPHVERIAKARLEAEGAPNTGLYARLLEEGQRVAAERPHVGATLSSETIKEQTYTDGSVVVDLPDIDYDATGRWVNAARKAAKSKHPADVPCSSCKVESGPCVTPKGRAKDDFHKPRYGKAESVGYAEEIRSQHRMGGDAMSFECPHCGAEENRPCRRPNDNILPYRKIHAARRDVANDHKEE